MDTNELEERIAAFPWWYYRFDFQGGVSTPVLGTGMVNRVAQLRAYMFEPLLGVLGGSLRGHRVLDLGCNAGMWSLCSTQAGADFVLGVDGLQMAVEQANFVFETEAVDSSRYRFEHGDVFAHEFSERFDVVLCLDFMDQGAKPVELFELMTRVGAETIVIETSLSPVSDSYFELRTLEDPLWTLDERMVLVPTREAVIDLAREFGFKVVPLAHRLSNYDGMSAYARGRRLAFICSRHASLDGLAVAPPQRIARSWGLSAALRGWRSLR
ncbi:MAG: class I SAM-dependent methyltransferase [Solirubrobacteraceae bacterium]